MRKTNAAVKKEAELESLCPFPLEDVIDRRVTMRMLVSCSYSLMQGNPDDSNRQRVDSDNHAIMTPMGVKRKIRDTAVMMGYAIHVSRGADLSQAVIHAARDIGVDVGEDPKPTTVRGRAVVDELTPIAEDDDEEIEDEDEEPETRRGKKSSKRPVAKKAAKKVASRKAKDEEEEEVEEAPAAAKTAPKGAPQRQKGHMLDATTKDRVIREMGKYFDFRLFGGVLTTLNHGERGAVQTSFGVTVDRVELMELANTRVAVANQKERQRSDRTMGSMCVIEYGLFVFDISISPVNCARTGMTWGDYELLIKILKRMWDNTKSTGRSKVTVEKIYSFIHSSPIGDAQDSTLCDAISVTKKSSANARSFKDYEIDIDETVLSKRGDRVIELYEIPVS